MTEKIICKIEKKLLRIHYIRNTILTLTTVRHFLCHRPLSQLFTEIPMISEIKNTSSIFISICRKRLLLI